MAAKKKIRIGRTIFIYSMILWSLIQFAIFWLYVNLDTILLSFQRFNILTGDYKFVGFINYLDLFASFKGYPDKILLTSVGNSLKVLGFNLFILLPISIIFAYILYKKVFMEKFFRVIFFFPSIISITVLTLVYKFMFDPNLGFITPIFKILHIDSLIPTNGWFADINTAFGMVLVYCLWAGIGYNVLLLTGALTRIPKEIIESAKLDGIGFFGELFHITLPLISSTISTLIIISTSSAFTLFLQPMMLTGGRPNNMSMTIMMHIVTSTKQGGNGVCSAATVGVFFSLVALPLIIGIKKILNKICPVVEF